MEGGLGGWGTPPDFVIVGSLCNNNSSHHKNVTSKVNLLCFKLDLTYSISFNSANNGPFLWSWILKDCSVEEKGNCHLVFPSSIKHEIRHFHVVFMQGQQRNVQESLMHMQSCCFANLNLLFFGHSRCCCHCRHHWLSCLISSLRKQPTFHYTTDGIPVKWHTRNKHRNSSCHYPDLGSASDWSKTCFNQSEVLPRSRFLQSFLRCHFTGKPLVILWDFAGFLKLISTNKLLRTKEQVHVRFKWVATLYGRILARWDGERNYSLFLTDFTACLASKAQFKYFGFEILLYCLLFQMKMPGSVGTKKAKAVEQLLEELGVGECLIPKCAEG